MTTKDRTTLSLYVPDDWIPAIDEARGETTRNAWILEAIRKQLGKRNFSEPPKRGRPPVYWYITFKANKGDMTELGHAFIDRETQLVVKRKSTMELDPKALATLIAQLTGSYDPRGQMVVGDLETKENGKIWWQEDHPWN